MDENDKLPENKNENIGMPEKKAKGGATALGLDENVESTLCYLLGWVSGLIFLFVEKENKNVRFHAMQSFLAFLSISIISVVIMIVPFLGPIVSFLLKIATLFLWILLLFKTFKGEVFRIPFFADLADEQLNKKKDAC